jgi:D-3-phosphoglycerate dehydrogenase
MRVLLIDPIDPAGVALLRDKAEVRQCSEASFDGIRRAAADVDAVITRSRLPDDFFDFAKNIKAVMIHGTGLDLVPLEAATERGIPVAKIPGGNAQSVAEYCVMSLLVLARNFPEIHSSIRTKQWDETRLLGAKAHEISGMTAGIVGVGEIGTRVARICRNGFGMRVLGNQRRLDRLPPEAEPAALDRLVAEADFVVVTCPLTPETHHLFNKNLLSKMKSTSWLINAGRGAVVEETALIEALRNKTIAGAMLDVYERRLSPAIPAISGEPVPTPHLSGMTQESRGDTWADAEETLRMLAGREIRQSEAWNHNQSADLRIVDIKAYRTSFPVPPENRVALVRHRAIEARCRGVQRVTCRRSPGRSWANRTTAAPTPRWRNSSKPRSRSWSRAWPQPTWSASGRRSTTSSSRATAWAPAPASP